MSDDYEWTRQRRRLKRQEENPKSDLDDKLEDGFAMMQDDDDLGDDQIQTDNGEVAYHQQRYSRQTKIEYERRKRTDDDN